jgi:hypothetical protein
VRPYGEDFRGRQVEWGGMIVSYETFPRGVDATPLFKGLPGDMCQSPHWGYILKGRMRVKRSGGDEMIRAGDVYYLEPGHISVFEEDTEILEFSPKRSTRRPSKSLRATWLQWKQRSRFPATTCQHSTDIPARGMSFDAA